MKQKLIVDEIKEGKISVAEGLEAYQMESEHIERQERLMRIRLIAQKREQLERERIQAEEEKKTLDASVQTGNAEDSMEATLLDKVRRQVFFMYLSQEGKESFVNFQNACDKYKKIKVPSSRLNFAEHVSREFIGDGAPQRVRVAFSTVRELESKIKTAKENTQNEAHLEVKEDLFNHAIRDMHKKMRLCFEDFKSDPIYLTEVAGQRNLENSYKMSEILLFLESLYKNQVLTIDECKRSVDRVKKKYGVVESGIVDRVLDFFSNAVSGNQFYDEEGERKREEKAKAREEMRDEAGNVDAAGARDSTARDPRFAHPPGATPRGMPSYAPPPGSYGMAPPPWWYYQQPQFNPRIPGAAPYYYGAQGGHIEGYGKHARDQGREAPHDRSAPSSRQAEVSIVAENSRLAGPAAVIGKDLREEEKSSPEVLNRSELN